MHDRDNNLGVNIQISHEDEYHALDLYQIKGERV